MITSVIPRRATHRKIETITGKQFLAVLCHIPSKKNIFLKFARKNMCSIFVSQKLKLSKILACRNKKITVDSNDSSLKSVSKILANLQKSKICVNLKGFSLIRVSKILAHRIQLRKFQLRRNLDGTDISSKFSCGALLPSITN